MSSHGLRRLADDSGGGAAHERLGARHRFEVRLLDELRPYDQRADGDLLRRRHQPSAQMRAARMGQLAARLSPLLIASCAEQYIDLGHDPPVPTTDDGGPAIVAPGQEGAYALASDGVRLYWTSKISSTGALESDAVRRCDIADCIPTLFTYRSTAAGSFIAVDAERVY